MDVLPAHGFADRALATSSNFTAPVGSLTGAIFLSHKTLFALAVRFILAL
jgi:hypothetical protein